MDRREAVKYISLLLGGTMVGANAMLTGCKTDDGKLTFSDDEIALLDEIAETILPATSTPGAKAAKVGAFMTVINEAAKKAHDKSFMKSSPQERHALLLNIDKEQKEYMKNKKEDEPNHYFRMMKELTLLGYFTSEIGSKQARRYVPVPGKYEGCIPYKKGDKAWA
jgi:hypothetical protein